MIVTLVINLVNAGLNYVFIFGKFGFQPMGLMGAGLATCIAFILEFTIMFTIGFRGLMSRRLFKTNPVETLSVDEEITTDASILVPEKSKESGMALFRFQPSGWRIRIPGVTASILRISHPTFWEELAISLGFLGFFMMIASFGESALAAHTSIVRIESFSFMAGYGISIAAMTLVGQALGSGSAADAKRSFTISISLGVIAMGSFGIFMCVAPEWFLGWFIADKGVSFPPIAMPLYFLTAIQQPFIGSTLVLAHGLRGAGETAMPFVAQLLGVTVIRVGLGYILAFPMGLGLEGIYWGTVFDWMLRTAVLILIFLRGNWETKKV